MFCIVLLLGFVVLCCVRVFFCYLVWLLSFGALSHCLFDLIDRLKYNLDYTFRK